MFVSKLKAVFIGITVLIASLTFVGAMLYFAGKATDAFTKRINPDIVEEKQTQKAFYCLYYKTYRNAEEEKSGVCLTTLEDCRQWKERSRWQIEAYAHTQCKPIRIPYCYPRKKQGDNLYARFACFPDRKTCQKRAPDPKYCGQLKL